MESLKWKCNTLMLLLRIQCTLICYRISLVSVSCPLSTHVTFVCVKIKGLIQQFVSEDCEGFETKVEILFRLKKKDAMCKRVNIVCYGEQ